MYKEIKPIYFPDDNQAHDAIIEWWYFNGHLKDKDDNHYSFMNCLFKADTKKVKIPYIKNIPFIDSLNPLKNFYFAHSFVSDISAQKNYKETQNISLVSRDSFNKPLLFANYISPILTSGYVNNEIVETELFNFNMKTEFMNLDLKSKKQPLLEGGEGHISVCDRESYYYSLTDLKTKGTINIDGKTIEVTGKSWMDHQWADVSYQEDKWSWFSIQLENGLDIMCVEYDDKKKKDFLVDMIDHEGKSEHYKNLILKPGNEIWKSSQTKAEYPLSWTIEIPDKNIVLKVRSLMSDQEFISNAINYWESPIEVVAIVDGKEVPGVGFMELVGYPSDFNYLLYMSKDIKKQVSEIFKKRS
ncbi:MAG: lipocalin-like domain-containing protein [Candidatus Paceibacterota bacterium]